MDKVRKIDYGDKIFARLMMNGRTVVEFMINRVSDMTELIGELRHMTYGAKGLAKLYIRNQTKGWSQERPLMLYSPDFGRQTSRMGLQTVASSASPFGMAVEPVRRMAFPWETH